MAAADEEKESRDDRSRLAKREAKAGKDAKTKNKGDAAHAAYSWTVTASQSSTVGPATSLIGAIRAALASERSACLAGSDAGKPIRVRVTVDAKGRIVRVELLAGDRERGALPAEGLHGPGVCHRRAGGPGRHRRDHAASKTLIDVCSV